LDAFRPDLMHIVNPVALGLNGFRYAKKTHLPVVASYHTDLPGFASRWGAGALNNVLWTYLRGLHNQADINFCPSQTTLVDLAQHGFQRLKVWSRGVDSQLFDPHKASAEWRWRLSGGHPEQPLLLYAGRLSAEKRVGWLAELLSALPGTRLAIIGDGPQRSALEAQFSNLPAVFTGYLKGEELAAAYASADLFAFPAANETFGNVVLEAMASGLPVVTARSGGPLDFVTHGKHGLLFQTESISSLVHCVRQLIEQPGAAHAMGQESRRFAEQRSWDSVLNKLLLDYQQLIDQKQVTRSKVSRTHASQPTFGW
jgi:phosphatidylinositol alpha 1,6-mannosyltransferase